MLEITVKQEQGRVPVWVFQLDGALDSDKQLFNKAQEAFDKGMRFMLLDMSKVPYMNSTGLRTIHLIFNLLRSDDPEESDEQVHSGLRSGAYKSHHLKLLKPNDMVMGVFHISGYEMFLEIYKDYKKAVASF